MRTLIKIISTLALVGSIGWVIADGGYEPVITGLGALAALIGLFVSEERGKDQDGGESEKDKIDEAKVKGTQVVQSISPKIGALYGAMDIRVPRGTVQEVFYKKPFKRTPHLDIKRGIPGALGTIEIVEQRKDGFKFRANDFESIDIRWLAEGEFED